ncbi:MAG: tRNA threonylcarbamoyladenosine dehydratase [Ruminococcus sp.]|nr:tRNA threonylcarbamoyladenosine dehydratase [Ruminococcus sp.]
MCEQFTRSASLLGDAAMARLKSARVAVFGVGGVGGYAVEALVRSGEGPQDIIDRDDESITNLNRQIIALHSTVGQDKVSVIAARMRDINPDVVIHEHKMFYLPENAHEIDLRQYDYVVDAVDTVAAKIELAVRCEQAGVPLIAAMGAGNKLDPTRFEVADIYKTSVCPLARVMRYECKKRGVKRLKVVYSKEPPVRPVKKSDEQTVRRDIPGSTAFVPSVAGLIIAGEVIKDMIG